jgi:site-specific recombinase XerD
MGKNGKFASFKIPQEAYQFLNHYLSDEQGPDAFVFPFLSNELDYTDEVFLKKQLEAKTALINKYLKKIAKKTEIDKNLTTHVARHTFASIARDKIEDISKIQKFLRHSSLRETQIYLGELTDKSLDESTDEIFG